MNNHIRFIHKLNDGGLLFLNHYLEKRCSCNVFHISPSKRLIYDGEFRDTCQMLKIKICARALEDEDAFYDAEEKLVVYKFKINESQQYLVFFPVEEKKVMAISEEISNIIMPLSYYLKGLYFSFDNYRKLLKNDPNKIFNTSNNDYWKNILKEQNLNPLSPVHAVIIDSSNNDIEIEKVRQLVLNLVLHDGDVDILQYALDRRIILIIPSRYHITLKKEQKSDEPYTFPLYAHYDELRKYFGEGFRIAVGRRVQLKDISLSYIQARMALFYLDYFRRPMKLIEFSSIGLAAYTFNNTFHQTKQELTDKYQLLNKYENERSGYLFSTLRELIRCQYNYQDAAHRLHMHLNTLYYRQDKLSSILGMDLTSFETKSILYGDIFMYDFIRHYDNF